MSCIIRPTVPTRSNRIFLDEAGFRAPPFTSSFLPRALHNGTATDDPFESLAFSSILLFFLSRYLTRYMAPEFDLDECIRMIFRGLYLLIPLTYLSGCVYFVTIPGGYPDEYPVLEEPVEGCPDISGLYEINGYGHSLRSFGVYNDTWSSRNLAHELEYEVEDQYTIVKLDQPDSDSLLVTFASTEAGRISSDFIPSDRNLLKLSDKDFRCENGMLWIPHPAPAGKWLNETGFRKAIDGSLIGKVIQVVDVGSKASIFHMWRSYSAGR